MWLFPRGVNKRLFWKSVPMTTKELPPSKLSWSLSTPTPTPSSMAGHGLPFTWSPAEMVRGPADCYPFAGLPLPCVAPGWWLWAFLLAPPLSICVAGSLYTAPFNEHLDNEHLDDEHLDDMLTTGGLMSISPLFSRVRMGWKTVLWLWRHCSVSCSLCVDWWWDAQPSNTELRTVTLCQSSIFRSPRPRSRNSLCASF